MKDLSILPDHLREAAMAAGGDFGWRLDLASEVIDALAAANAVVVGVEAWSVDAEGVPASVGWSSYEVGDWEADWPGAVAIARTEAHGVLEGVLETASEDDVNYVGIDWWDTPETAANADVWP